MEDLAARQVRGFGITGFGHAFRVALRVFAVIVLGQGIAKADIRLPAWLSDHSVLQRDTRLTLRGSTSPGGKVELQFRGEKKAASADAAGNWSIVVGPLAAGGPYTMRFTSEDGHETLVRNILIGDVWVAAGQSNMQYPVQDEINEVIGADREVAAANFPQIRFFAVPRRMELSPKSELSAGTWLAVSPETVSRCSAVGYFFARELFKRYQVPIGVVVAVWPGTTIQPWISASALPPEIVSPKEVDELSHIDAAAFEHYSRGEWAALTPQLIASLPAPTAPKYTPTVLFNGMISPLTEFSIKGVIWYQGESDAMEKKSAIYRVLFPKLIEDWRRHWNAEIPFIFVQLPGYGWNKADPSDYSWAELREAQLLALALPRTAMAATVDLGDEEDLHPPNKQDVARRLALAARSVAYSEGIEYSGPTLKSWRVETNRIRLTFANTGGGIKLKGPGGTIRGFEVAGEDMKYESAQAIQDGSDIVVFSRNMERPAYVRYDWCNMPRGNVLSSIGLPARPFRTDQPAQATRR